MLTPHDHEALHDLKEALNELLDLAGAQQGDLLVVGCSTSEIRRAHIGSHPAPELGEAVVDTILTTLAPRGVHLAAQCCEHLNRALVMETDEALRRGYTRVHAVPIPEAGGSFATATYAAMDAPCLVETIQADLGLDIGDTFIGMHLKRVAVPVRLQATSIGAAHLTAARTRLPFTGGVRAVYDQNLL